MHVQFCAALGSCLPPFAFLVVLELSRSTPAALIAATLLIFGQYDTFESQNLSATKHMNEMMSFKWTFLFLIRHWVHHSLPVHPTGPHSHVFYYGSRAEHGQVQPSETQVQQCAASISVLNETKL